MLLQTLCTRDFDELAQGFPLWDIRCRQLGRGPFRGQLQFLQQGGIQVFQLAVNRMIHIEGGPPPGSFGFSGSGRPLVLSRLARTDEDRIRRRRSRRWRATASV